jgi:hypothetical protein
MGDMEDAEVRSFRRDAQLDWYYDWLQGFEYKSESRASLISWLRFTWYCVPCGSGTEITRRGKHSYEGYCEHVFDREGLDLSRADDVRHAEYERLMSLSELRDCPIHLVRVPLVDWYRDYRARPQRDTEVLGCGCHLVQPPERRPCYSCPPLVDGTLRAPRVVRRFVVEAHRDPTAAYELECGHSTIDL